MKFMAKVTAIIAGAALMAAGFAYFVSLRSDYTELRHNYDTLYTQAQDHGITPDVPAPSTTRGDDGTNGRDGRDSTVPGPQGPTGPAGPEGAVGPQGPAGANGSDSSVPGPQGAQGTPGPEGSPGPAGPTVACNTLDPALGYLCLGG